MFSRTSLLLLVSATLCRALPPAPPVTVFGYMVDENGLRVSIVVGDGGETGLNETAQPCRLRPIVHVDACGNAWLLDPVNLWAVRLDAKNLPVFRISREEDALLPAGLGETSRISVAHRPPGADLALAGGLAPGGNLLIGHDGSFCTATHPDLDNLASRFEAPLPEGVESDEGLRRFIYSVTDLGLHLKTYSYSGN